MDVGFLLDSNRLLSVGQFSDVFWGRTLHNSRQPAYKMHKVHMENVRDILAIQRHDNLVYHYDSFIYENRLVLTMDIIQNQTLKTYLQNGSPSKQQLERIAKEILEGLIFLHKKQCVHNGIRAENILLDEQDKLRPKVGGFSQMNNPRPLNFPSHHAPELYTQNEMPNQRSDVWSYGMTLYEMSIRGSHVYRHDSGECLSSTQIIYALITERLPFTDNVNNITEWTESKLQQCLQWNPADRPTFSDLNL